MRSIRLTGTVAALTLSAAALCGCGTGDLTIAEADPEAAPAHPTWSMHIEPIMEFHCVACHDPGGQAGAQEGYAYHTCEATRRGWGELVETVFEESSMPPGGAMRLQPWEELTLLRWREQGSSCD